jgi:hypothetical protein
MLCAGAWGASCLCRENRLPMIPCDLPPDGVGDCPSALPLPKGFARVLLCAFFSRSSTFFLNCLASFSSAKLSPARHSSNSKVWKNVRSWLYENVS